MKKEVTVDIRMKIVDEACAMQYLSSLPESWVYIKNLSRIEEERQVEQVTTYTKFKVRSVDIERQTILIYGTEDIDRLVIDKNLIASYQMTPVMDELYIPIVTDNNSIDIYIKKYIPNIRNRFVEILQSTQNLIITEGKTDWKHLKRALSYFQSNGIYKDINFAFLESDEREGGENILLKFLDFDRQFYNPNIKIYIFDADVDEVNKQHEGKRFVDWGNNVYSFILPIPDNRRDTPLISIENYYTDEDIKIYDHNGRRLYMNHEFDPETGLLKDNTKIFDTQHGKHKKKAGNFIIDDQVFLVPEEIPTCDENIYKITQNCPNIALTKNHFADYILKAEKPFDKVCFYNFRLVFDIITEIQNRSKNNNTKYENFTDEKEIAQGAFIKTFDNGLKVLEIYVRETEKTLNICKSGFFSVEPKIEKDTYTFRLILHGDTIGSLSLQIQLSIELLEFLHDKIDNQYNRIELHFVDNDHMERVIEVLADDIAGGCIDRELCKLYD